MEITKENKLEKFLRLASSEPAYRPQFCEVLMESQIFIIQPVEESDGGHDVVHLKEGDEFRVEQWVKSDGSLAIPFFSSVEVLRKSIKNDVSYIALPVRYFFELVQGAKLVLNPMSDDSKEFNPEEVNNLLSIGIGQAVQQRVVTEETTVSISQPSHYPQQMVDSLTQLLAKHSNVKKAYLALIHDSSVDDRPNLIIGIEAEGDFENIMKQIGSVAAESAGDMGPVDLYQVGSSDSGLSQYFLNETKPFYEKKTRFKLRSLFGLN